MFEITKSEPIYFKRAKSKVKLPKIKSAWEDSNISAIRKRLREEILLKEQNLLCAYCEREIDSDRKNSNIDHFKTRNLYPEETLNYNNLLVSCNSQGKSCSSSKDSQKSILKVREDYQNIVNPTLDNPDDYFEYITTGEIIAKDNSLKANYTIKLFRLGSIDDKDNSLVKSREKIANALKNIPNLSLEEIYSIFGNEYHSFIKAIYPKLGVI